MSAQPLQFIHRGAAEDPPSGLSYPLVLRPVSGIEGLFGILCALAGFVLIVPTISQLVLMAAHVFRGGDFDAYVQAARAYAYPEGVLAGHLALASLTIIALLVALYVHGRLPRWTFSVQPGLRWRYLLATFIVAAVLLNGMLWLSFTWQQMPTFNTGQPDAWWFLAVVLVTSPLQALAEEVFFRGYLLQAFGSLSGQFWVGIVLSSLIFAMMHGTQNPALFTHRLAFGLISGLLVWGTGGLEAGIAAHVVNNLGAFGYAIFTTSVAEVRATAEIGWDKAAWDTLTFTLFALIAWWIARRMRVATTTP